jgi:glyoxylate/hydroxypyruvate reductase A
MSPVSSKVTLIAYEPSFRRVEPLLAEWRNQLTPILLSRDGTPQLENLGASSDTVVAWASPEVFVDGRLGQFVSYVLSRTDVEWFQSGSAGHDSALLRSVINHCSRFTVNPAPANSIAEYVFSAVLDHFQSGERRRSDRRSKIWRPFYFREIAGTTWLILGYGAIGKRIAKRAQAFEAQVIAVNRSGRADLNANEIHNLDALPDLLPRADVVVLAMPLSAETAKIADDTFFSRMKPSAVFVNVSRGGLVDESALLRGMDRAFPDHAILDVFSAEPLPADSPFWTHDRLSMSPHSAGMGGGLIQRSDRIFIENFRHFLRGEPLEGEVGRPTESRRAQA